MVNIWIYGWNKRPYPKLVLLVRIEWAYLLLCSFSTMFTNCCYKLWLRSHFLNIINYAAVVSVLSSLSTIYNELITTDLSSQFLPLHQLLTNWAPDFPYDVTFFVYNTHLCDMRCVRYTSYFCCDQARQRHTLLMKCEW